MMRAFVIAAALVGLLLLVVFASGSTFGQRCDKLYPNGTPLQHERCVNLLSKGVDPNELP